MAENKFTWISFYTELAEKLLEYKNDRTQLVKFIFAEDGLQEFSDYLHLQDKSQKITDIDPFSFMGMFNRGSLSSDKRIKILEKIKEAFNVKSDIPLDFDGIPVLNYARMFFYDWNNLKESCDRLWKAYEAMMKGDLTPWFEYYNIDKRKAECTMPLFWCNAQKYIALDSRNVNYLKGQGVEVNVYDAESYLNLLQAIKKKIQLDESNENLFVLISYSAWKNSKPFKFSDFCNAIKSKFKEGNIGLSLAEQKTYKKYAWVFSEQFETTNKCHYEFCADNDTSAGHVNKHIYVEIHLENKEFTEHFEHVLNRISGLHHFIWKYSDSGYRMNDEGYEMKGDVNEVADNVIAELIELDNLVGKIIKQTIQNMNTDSKMTKYNQIISHKKNIILQGAPGTGKTYNTAALALSICGVQNVDLNDHKAVMDCYEQMRYDKEKNPNGQIGFCTFHQSMDYEDFVEGIKPKTENGIVGYDIEDGIFKIMCANANKITTTTKNTSPKIDFTKTRVFKISLGEKGKDGDEIFDYCIENNVIALGWGEDKDFSGCQTREDFKSKYIDDNERKWGAVAMEIFKQWMQIGDIVLVSHGTKSVKAIAKIVGNYEYRSDATIDMCQFRKVEWLYVGDLIPISKIYHKNLSQQSIYALYDSRNNGKIINNAVNVDVLNDIITGEINDAPIQNYVLIIDEINRGNVSRIFGELITLLEADKRIGDKHPINVTLPYSKESFGVPSNLYIIGTMNTTDRSVGNIDYAVRRRFAFVTLKADKGVLEKECGVGSKQVNLFESVEAFIKRNKTEMDFEDLMVGHSYFFAKGEPELEMRWQYEILPLLNEYIKDGIIRAERLESDMTVEDFCKKYPSQMN